MKIIVFIIFIYQVILQCQRRQYLNDNGECANCLASCKSCNNGQICLSCDPISGRILYNGKCVCQAGYYEDTAATCLKCNWTCKTCIKQNDNICQKCPKPHNLKCNQENIINRQFGPIFLIVVFCIAIILILLQRIYLKVINQLNNDQVYRKKKALKTLNRHLRYLPPVIECPQFIDNQSSSRSNEVQKIKEKEIQIKQKPTTPIKKQNEIEMRQIEMQEEYDIQENPTPNKKPPIYKNINVQESQTEKERKMKIVQKYKKQGTLDQSVEMNTEKNSGSNLV